MLNYTAFLMLIKRLLSYAANVIIVIAKRLLNRLR